MRVIVRFSAWPAGLRGVTMLYRKHIRWTDLPIERRRRLAVILGELIQRRMSADREADHDGGPRPDAA